MKEFIGAECSSTISEFSKVQTKYHSKPNLSNEWQILSVALLLNPNGIPHFARSIDLQPAFVALPLILVTRQPLGDTIWQLRILYIIYFAPYN